MSPGFLDRVSERIAALDTTLVLGVDPHLDDLEAPTAEAALRWASALLEQAGPSAVAVKPNASFFEALPGGCDALAAFTRACPLPVLLDFKRGDIGSTAAAHARYAYDRIGADAVTAQPWLGRDAVEPLLQPGKAVFVLCRTSNPSASEVQLLPTVGGAMYAAVAERVLGWGEQVGLVVGATDPGALAVLRSQHPGAWLLAPGVGAQGASPEHTVEVGCRADGRGLLVPVSRAIARAPDPGAAAAQLARRLAPRPRPSTPGLLDTGLLVGLIGLGCVRFGTFKLRSGAISPVYVDCRRVIGAPRLLAALAAALAPHLDGVDRVAGVPTAGVPLATALSLVADLPLLYPRPQAKAHGTGRQVEGGFAPGDRVALVDDVATSGISLIEALDVLEGAGLVVDRALVLVDRQDGAREALAARGVRLHALFGLDALLALAPGA